MSNLDVIASQVHVFIWEAGRDVDERVPELCAIETLNRCALDVSQHITTV